MKYRILSLMPFLALVSCAHPRIDPPCSEPVTDSGLRDASGQSRISPSWGDPLKIDPTKPPNGMHLVQILLENQSLPMKGTNCESNLFGENRRLQQKLAMILGYAFDRPHHHAVLSAGCEADQYELPSGKMIDAWQCNLSVVEKDEEGDNIASANIYFGITKDTWEIIPVPRALTCT